MTHRKVYTVKDHACSGEEFELVPVSGSSLLKTLPVPDNLQDYYQSHYISHEDNPSSIIGKIYQWVKRYMLRQKLGWVRNWSPDGSTLLDVGAGTGAFLEAAAQRGWSTMGTEPSQSAREKAREKGVEVKASLDDLHDKKFDAVTLWHVLEHIPKPDEAIRAISGLLSDDGVVVIALPNYQSLDAKIYQSLWAAYDVPRHLWHFDADAITHFMKELGYVKIDQIPLLFDAFYVSLVSETFRTNGGNKFRGLLNGLRSNLDAMRTGEYSSLVYVFKKR